MTGNARSCHGLSLLEVLVTLTIFSMLFFVLTMGWYQTMDAQSKLSDVAQRARAHQQIALSIRQAINEALVPAYQAGTDFTADARGFMTESTTALLGASQSAPLTVSIKLENTPSGQRLQISHADRESRAFPWLFSKARWRYLDGQHDWHEVWPPPPPALGMPLPVDRDSYLPILVAFSYVVAGETKEHELLAAPRASSWRLAEPSSPLVGFDAP